MLTDAMQFYVKLAMHDATAGYWLDLLRWK